MAKKTDKGQAGFAWGAHSLVGDRQTDTYNLTRVLRWGNPRAVEAQRVTQSEIVREGLPKRAMIKFQRVNSIWPRAGGGAAEVKAQSSKGCLDHEVHGLVCHIGSWGLSRGWQGTTEES